MNNPTPSEADVKLAKEIIEYLDDFYNGTEHHINVVSQIIIRHMQPEHDELERLRKEHQAIQEGLTGIGPIDEIYWRVVVTGQRREIKKLTAERDAAQKPFRVVT